MISPTSLKLKLFPTLILFVLCINLHAQETPADLPWTASDCGILNSGIAAITCGVVVNQPVADRYTFALLDINGAVPGSGRVEQTANQDVYHHPSWHIDSIGNVYGVEMTPTGDILLTASSNYGAAYWSQEAVVRYGDIGGGAESLAAAGTVYIIDGATGQASVFAVLPQQSTTLTHYDCEIGTSFNRTSGEGLGNIVYDPINDQYFVTNIEDGRIYRLDANGNILDSYDPGIYDDGAAGISIMNDLAYGLAIEPGSGRLFYGGVYSDTHAAATTTTGAPSIYSIDLDASGGFVGTVDNSVMPAGATYDNYVGNEQLHVTLATGGGNTYTTNTQYFISDLEFTPSGELLAGVRVGCQNSFQTSYNHWGETNIISLNTATNLYDSAADYDISVTGDAGADDNYGGVAYYELADGSVQYAASSADILQENGPHGIAVFPSDASTTTQIAPLGAISYGTVDDSGNGDPKGVGGEIDIFNECFCPVAVNLTNDNTGDVCYSGTPIDIIYTLEVDSGSTPTDFTVLWEVNNVLQADTDTSFTVSIMPPSGACAPFTPPVVTAKIICAITGDTSVAINNTSPAFLIYNIPQAGVDYSIQESNCIVEIIDSCGNLTITNDQGTGRLFSINEGDPDTDVTFTLMATGSPAGCEVTELSTVSCLPLTDLALEKVVDNAVTAIGNTIVYTLTVYNEHDAVDATGVEITDVLPIGLTYVSDDSGGAYDDATGLWTVGTVAVGDSATLQITATVDAVGVIFNNAEITGLNESDNDSTPNNGNIEEDDFAAACISIPIEYCYEDSLNINVELMAEMGYTNYQWYKDNVLIAGATTDTYLATEPGVYTYTLDGVGPTGDCQGELCCPVIIELINCCEPIECIPVTLTRLKKSQP